MGAMIVGIFVDAANCTMPNLGDHATIQRVEAYIKSGESFKDNIVILTGSYGAHMKGTDVRWLKIDEPD